MFDITKPQRWQRGGEPSVWARGRHSSEIIGDLHTRSFYKARTKGGWINTTLSVAFNSAGGWGQKQRHVMWSFASYCLNTRKTYRAVGSCWHYSVWKILSSWKAEVNSHGKTRQMLTKGLILVCLFCLPNLNKGTPSLFTPPAAMKIKTHLQLKYGGQSEM